MLNCGGEQMKLQTLQDIISAKRKIEAGDSPTQEELNELWTYYNQNKVQEDSNV
jgi:hypothetical protein